MTPATKPVRRKVSVRAPHGVSSQIVLTIYPDGLIGLRELGRPARTEKQLDIAQLYVNAIFAENFAFNRKVASLRRNGHGLREARRIATGK